MSLLLSETLYSVEVAPCIIGVAADEFDGSTLILYTEGDVEGAETGGQVARYLSDAQMKVLIFTTLATLTYTEHPFVVPVQNIIWIFDPDNFLEQLSNVRTNMLWKSTSKFILIPRNNQLPIEETFALLWHHARVANVIMLSSDRILYTWFPYQKNKCNQNITAVQVGICTDGELNHSNELFPLKFGSNLNNCSVYAITSIVYPYVGVDPSTGQVKDGIEVSIVNTFIEKYGGKLEYLRLPAGEPFYTYDDSQSSKQGASRLLSSYQADFAFGSMFQSSQHSTYGDVLQLPHSNDELIWFIPQPQEIPPAKNVYRAFESEVWVLVSLALVSIAIIFYLTEKAIKGDKWPELSFQLLYAAAITLNYPVAMPKTLLLKSFLMIGFIYGLHVVTAYQSSLISFLTKPIMENPIESVKEGIAKGLIPYMYEPHRPYIELEGFPDQQLILQKGRHIFRTEMKFQFMTTFQDKMILGVRSTTLFYLTWTGKVDENKQLLVRLLEPGVLSFYVTIVCSRGNPLKENLETTVNQLIESGLKEKWKDSLLENNELVISLDKHKPLTTESLTGTFFILLAGITAGFLMFLAEITYRKLGNK